MEVQPGEGAAARALRAPSRAAQAPPRSDYERRNGLASQSDVDGSLRQPGADTSLRRSPGRLRAAVATARPRQWLKNALVIAAPGAAGALGRDDVPLRVGLAFIAFCLLASGIYAINDVRDVEEDRRHPTKRHRPVAAGELPERQALFLGAALMVLGLALCAAITPLLALVGAGYLALTLTYTLIWRHVPLLDVSAIAGGFVLRAVAGGVAAPVELSKWFLLVISFAAVLVAAGKRWAELRRTALAGGEHRRVLHRYTEGRLAALLVASAVGALFTYCMWAFALPTFDGFPWRPLTILPFAACLLRYGTLVRAGESEAPDELIFADKPLLLAALAWLILFALGVHAGS
jgi:decaprenyl-phosphate phosphoribosyltransferase